MGLKIESEEESMDLLVESMRNTYSDSLREALKDYEFSFVISDPRLLDNPIVYASEGFFKMTGYSRDEVLGRNCRFLQGPDTDRRTVLELRDAIREERPAQVRILNYTKQGKPFWNLFHLAPVFSKADGTVIHFVGVQTPISSQLATIENISSCIISPEILPPKKTDLVVRCRKENGVILESRLITAKIMSSCLLGSTDQLTVNRFTAAEESQTRKSQGPEEVKAMDSVKCLVSQLVASSKGKGGVDEKRCKQLSECADEGVVSSSLMLSLTRIQQSFVLADPNLPDMPIVHASDLFLHLTGYSREEVVGHNCRFLQGPDTDPAAVAQIRESIKQEKSCSVRILNYRKDKRPFWNLLHLSPVRSCGGKVSFYVGVQLQVLAADEEIDDGRGLSAQMKQLSTVGAIRVAVRSLQGEGLRRCVKGSSSEKILKKR
uniref:Putative LOV domain-containing protein n=1 Tax=Conocephalum conicum TaxID=41839 RepID=A0A126WYK0_CONCI|nr:putative LOV domain-containing protein [Conocephalum conicum]